MIFIRVYILTAARANDFLMACTIFLPFSSTWSSAQSRLIEVETQRPIIVSLTAKEVWERFSKDCICGLLRAFRVEILFR